MERHSKIKRFKEMCGCFAQKNMQYEQSKTSLEQKGKIMGALIKAGVTQADIAKRADVKQPTVSYVISGKSRSRKIERIITELTGFRFPANQRVTRERVVQI